MSYPNSEYKAFSFDVQSSLLTTTAGNLQHYNGFAVPIYPILHTAPPILRNQNTDQESWKADRKAWKEHAEEDWFTGQSEEPYLPHNGKSILVRWLNDEGQGWTCCVPLDVEGRWCDHKPFGRIDRALAHVRKHLNLKPFPCEEHCGTEGWYVPEFSL